MTEQKEVHKDTLKVKALLERLSNIVATYEDQDAERRVQITNLANENQELRNQVDSLVQQLATDKESNELVEENPGS